MEDKLDLPVKEYAWMDREGKRFKLVELADLTEARYMQSLLDGVVKGLGAGVFHRIVPTHALKEDIKYGKRNENHYIRTRNGYKTT